MSNPGNQLIPQKYIQKDLHPILLNESAPYKVFSTWTAVCAVLDNDIVFTWGYQGNGGQQPKLPNSMLFGRKKFN